METAGLAYLGASPLSVRNGLLLRNETGVRILPMYTHTLHTRARAQTHTEPNTTTTLPQNKWVSESMEINGRESQMGREQTTRQPRRPRGSQAATSAQWWERMALSPPPVNSMQHFVKWNIGDSGNPCKQAARTGLRKGLKSGGDHI